jgi:hypothetical protein
MGATEDAISLFHVVADDSATAMDALRRQRVDRAFKAVEDMLLSSQNYFKGFVVIISTDFVSEASARKTPGSGQSLPVRGS